MAESVSTRATVSPSFSSPSSDDLSPSPSSDDLSPSLSLRAAWIVAKLYGGERVREGECCLFSPTGPTRFRSVDVESNERITDRSMETFSVEDSGITRWMGPWRERECVRMRMCTFQLTASFSLAVK